MDRPQPRWWTVTWMDTETNTLHHADHFAHDEGEVLDQFYQDKDWNFNMHIVKIIKSFL